MIAAMLRASSCCIDQAPAWPGAGVTRRGLVCLVAVAAALGRPARAQDEVPFIATPDHVTLAMLELAKVGPRDTVLDLGSGDGRIVITAAKRFGARGLGVELSPELVQRSRDHARQAGVEHRVEFRVQDLFQTDLRQASVITMYLLPEVNLQLRPALLRLAPGTRIVSHDWDMGDWPPDRTVTLPVPDKPVGLEKSSRVHLWTVPAQLAGRWCAGAIGLQIEQRYQAVRATLRSADGRRLEAGGRIEGTTLRLAGPGEADRLTLHRQRDGQLRAQAAGGGWRAAARRVFRLAGRESPDCR